MQLAQQPLSRPPRPSDGKRRRSDRGGVGQRDPECRLCRRPGRGRPSGRPPSAFSCPGFQQSRSYARAWRPPKWHSPVLSARKNSREGYGSPQNGFGFSRQPGRSAMSRIPSLSSSESQASPKASPSAFSCPGFQKTGQLSAAMGPIATSGTPSKSVSTATIGVGVGGGGVGGGGVGGGGVGGGGVGGGGVGAGAGEGVRGFGCGVPGGCGAGAPGAAV